MKMLELVLGFIIAVPIIFMVRLICHGKGTVLAIREKHRDKFYELAEKVVGWEKISDSALSHLSFLSRTLCSRRTQFKVISVIRLAARGSLIPAKAKFMQELSPEEQKIWRVMFYHWLVAICAQGSFIGVYALFQITNFLDADEVDAKIEPTLSREMEKELCAA
jgi:hypothetical protein